MNPLLIIYEIRLNLLSRIYIRLLIYRY